MSASLQIPKQAVDEHVSGGIALLMLNALSLVALVVVPSSACRGEMATPKQAKAVVRMLVFIMMSCELNINLAHSVVLASQRLIFYDNL